MAEKANNVTIAKTPNDAALRTLVFMGIIRLDNLNIVGLLNLVLD